MVVFANDNEVAYRHLSTIAYVGVVGVVDARRVVVTAVSCPGSFGVTFHDEDPGAFANSGAHGSTLVGLSYFIIRQRAVLARYL